MMHSRSHPATFTLPSQCALLVCPHPAVSISEPLSRITAPSRCSQPHPLVEPVSPIRRLQRPHPTPVRARANRLEPIQSP
jgi:hypothetical protein